MSDQPEALRLAQEFEVAWSDVTPCVQAALMLRRQHSRIEADEALMRMAAEALESAKFVLDVAICMYLVRVPEDADGPVVQIPEAITALRTRLEEAK